jgi:hypothetical protein
MAKVILLDEIHVSVLVPRGLRRSQCQAIRRVLNGKRFFAELSRSLRAVLRRHRSLSPVQVKLSR